MKKDNNQIIVVVGGGPTGLATAIALARENIATHLVASKPLETDPRTSALMAGSIEFMADIGLKDAILKSGTPMKGLRIIDATNRLIRAPETLFTAAEIGLDMLGINILNRNLVAALEARAKKLPCLSRHFTTVTAVHSKDEDVELELGDGTKLIANVVAAADGKHSICREAAGIELRQTSYKQSALVTVLSHELNHNNISTEFHLADGPMTFVPLGSKQSSLVWMDKNQITTDRQNKNPGDQAKEIAAKSQYFLGNLELRQPAASFPLYRMDAASFAQNRIALIGEAAHLFPPIGAQGLNLGLRDANDFSKCVKKAVISKEDCGSPSVMRRYHNARYNDIVSRTGMVHMLNQSLTSALPFGQTARAIGLHTLQWFPQLRHQFMRKGALPRNNSI